MPVVYVCSAMESTRLRSTPTPWHHRTCAAGRTLSHEDFILPRCVTLRRRKQVRILIQSVPRDALTRHSINFHIGTPFNYIQFLTLTILICPTDVHQEAGARIGLTITCKRLQDRGTDCQGAFVIPPEEANIRIPFSAAGAIHQRSVHLGTQMNEPFVQAYKPKSADIYRRNGIAAADLDSRARPCVTMYSGGKESSARVFRAHSYRGAFVRKKHIWTVVTGRHEARTTKEGRAMGSGWWHGGGGQESKVMTRNKAEHETAYRAERLPKLTWEYLLNKEMLSHEPKGEK
ncbi:hypothetical protein DFH07DRAFT_784603 [Mycena maculata]|uniref:Uncharacterized protein n=1 Tax=Mycena maculata TaxID=230809 RepID=A0AAD7HFS4_9AGAR|nr:hypothetical protein DFH07DRAFT_784603 [Mycena maculata]